MNKIRPGSKTNRTVALCLIFVTVLLASACSSTGRTTNGAIDSLAIDLPTSIGEPEEAVSPGSSGSALESGIAFTGRALLLDPVLRPVTTIKAVIGRTFKSTAGFLERAFILRIRFPQLEKTPIPELSIEAPMDLQRWEQDLDDLTDSERSTGSIRFLIDGNEYFPRLYRAIDESTQSIDIQTYIFDNDDVALKLANRLRQRAADVEVKVLVDGLADLINTQHDSPSMPANVKLPGSISSYLSYDSRLEFRKQSNPWLTSDHSKITLIDEQTAFLGGMNIGREYRYDWHDLMMEVHGPIVQELQFEFEKSWVNAGMSGDYGLALLSMRSNPVTANPQQGEYPIRILTTSIHNSALYRAQIEAIRRTRDYIYIQNAYFSDDKILFELARARRRGVDVRVIIPAASDIGILDLSNQKTVNTMLRNGIRVYAYPGMTHVKAAVYDGWACLGSANFDKLSLQINSELNLATSHSETVNTLLERVFLPDFEMSTELHEPFPLGVRHHWAEFIADEFL